MSSLRLTSTECVIALRQLTKALEATQEWIEQWFNHEDSAPIVPHNALPSNRRSIKFIQAVFKHNFSPSEISDAIEAVEELQFEATRHREETEGAFQHLLTLYNIYNIQSLRTIQVHASVESLASVSTHVSVRTLASISSRIAECSAVYAEGDGEHMVYSNDSIRWLQEQALQAELRPPPVSAHVLSDDEDEDATSEDDSSVRVWLSKHSTLTELWCIGCLNNRYRQGIDTTSPLFDQLSRPSNCPCHSAIRRHSSHGSVPGTRQGDRTRTRGETSSEGAPQGGREPKVRHTGVQGPPEFHGERY